MCVAIAVVFRVMSGITEGQTTEIGKGLIERGIGASTGDAFTKPEEIGPAGVFVWILDVCFQTATDAMDVVKIGWWIGTHTCIIQGAGV